MTKRLEDYSWKEVQEYENWDPYLHPFNLKALEYRIVRDEWERRRKERILSLLLTAHSSEVEDLESELFDLMTEKEIRDYQTRKLQDADSEFEVELN